jgi:putative SOS response-associated peptidase YedK
MCGRYSLTIRKKDLVERFEILEEGPDVGPRYNIAPTQPALLVVPSGGGRRLVEARWAFPVPWDCTARGAINARSESLAEKPTFRRLLDSRRCAVPADGFYEWQAGGGRSRPWRFTLADGGAFAFAGLWQEQADAGARFLILTTAPNPLVAPVHSRMPVILQRAAERAWLDPERPFDRLEAGWNAPYPSDLLRAVEVGPAVNSVHNDSPACLAPPSPPQPELF